MKTAVKKLTRIMATVLVLPIYVSHVFASKVGSADGSLESHSQLIALFPGRIGNLLRNAFYRLTLQHCDPTATICYGVLISKTSAVIGRNVYVGPRCMLGWVTLGDDVLLGPAVQIPSGPLAHTFESLEIPIREQPRQPKCVSVGADSWIGAASVVLADVGSQTIVGANSTVTKPIPARTIAVGSPARSIQNRQTVAQGQHSSGNVDPQCHGGHPEIKTPNHRPAIADCSSLPDSGPLNLV